MADPETASGPDVASCRECAALVASRSQIVNGTGPRDAAVLFVGEAPGSAEDQQGEPFVGRSGEVLDETLAGLGIPRETVRITNCVRCRPPDNRDPTASELANCRGHLDSEVAAVDPTLVVTLGKVPSEHLLGREVAITAAAGSTERVDVGGASRQVLLCLHPAATLYDPSQADRFEATLAQAANLAGLEREGAGEDQVELGAFRDSE